MKGPLRLLLSAASLLAAGLWLLRPATLVPPGGDGAAASQYISATMRAARLSSALAALQDIKLQLIAFVEQQGRFPNDNQELGLAPPHTFHRGALRSVRIEPGGRIVAGLGGAFPREARILLTPEASTDQQDLYRWRCQLHGVPLDTAAFAAGCEIADQLDLTEARARAQATDTATPPQASPPARLRKGYLSRELERAIDKADRTRIRELLARGADYRGGPLVAAARRDLPEVVRWMLDAGADPNQPNLFGETALQAAIPRDAPPRPNAVAIVAQLLRQGADPNRRDERDETPLMRLIGAGEEPPSRARDRRLAIARALLDHGADPRGGDRPDALDKAAGATALLDLLLDHVDAGKLEKTRRSAWVDDALRRDDAPRLAVLSRHGIHIEEATLSDRYSRYLRLSAINQRDGAARASTAPPVGDDPSDHDTRDALLRHDWERLIELLRNGRPLPRRVRGDADDAGASVFTYLLQQGGVTVTRRVLAAIDDLERYPDEQGESPLFEALNHGYSELIEPMLRAGADPRAKDRRGRSALRLALALRDREATRALLAAGALPDEPSALRRLAELAWDAGFDDIAGRIEKRARDSATRWTRRRRLAALIEHPRRQLWAERCAPERGAWLALFRDRDRRLYLLGANGRAITPLPGFPEPLASDDPRLRWLDDGRLALSPTAAPGPSTPRYRSCASH